MVNDSPKTKRHQKAVAQRAALAFSGHAVAGPVYVSISFFLPRPKHHLGTGRNAGVVKPRYVNAWPDASNRNDIDKLTRLVLDAMTGVIYEDDGQVVACDASKRYATECDASKRYATECDAHTFIVCKSLEVTCHE